MPSGGTITGFSNCSNSCGSSISQPLTNSGTTSGIVRYTITPLHDGCQGDPVDIDITVHPSVLQPSVTTPVNYCLGSPSTPLIATPTAGGQIYWYTTPTGGTASTIVPVPPTSTAGTTTWYVSQTDGSTGCEGPRIPITVNVHPLPTATISGSTTVCQNAASPVVTFTGGVGQPPFTFTYQVNGGAETTIQTTSGNSVTLPVGTANPGTFTYTLIKVLDSRGCEQAQTGSISITVNPSTQLVNAPTPQIVCIGGSITFSVWATGLDIQYQWQKNTTGNNYVPVDGANSSSFTISNVTSADATNYRVVITGTCGTITTTPVALTVNPLPVCSITGNNSICVGQTTSFSAPSGMLSYLWSGPDGFTSNTQSTGNISIAGTYSVQITNTNGCVSTCERILTINPNPDITISPSPATICNGSSISLTANGANSYIWSPGTGLSATTGATVTANPTVTTTYTVIGTITATGCSNTAQVVVNVNPKPNILITPASSTICNGESTTLTASGGINYTWSPATGLSATSGGTVTASPTATTTYTVTGTDANGCTNTSTVTVTVNPIPTVAKPSDRTVCNGTSITSIIFSGTPSSGVIYSWINNNTSIGLPETGTGNTPTFTAVNTGTEPVTATITVTPSYTFNGVTCIGTPQTFTITVDPTTRITTNLENLSLCLGTSQTLVIEATGLNMTYLWEENTSGNNWRIISGATTNQYTLPNVTAAMNGYRYRVTVTGKCGQAQSIATLTVKPLPICSITGNNNVCPSSTNTYSAPNQAGYTYNWTISGNATISGGTSGQTVSVLAGPTCGSYTLTLVTTLNGCSVTCSQTYNITDTTAPVWTTAAGILNRTLECTDLAGIANAQTLAPVATDLCNIITYEKTSGSFSPGACPQTGTYTNTWIARDACNNISSVYTQVITVVNTIPPVVPSAGSATVACPANAVAPTPPAVTDACGNPVPAVLTSTVDTPDPVDCGGTRIYTYTYTDCAGNKNTWSYTYTILEPVWQAPVAGSQTVACPTEAIQPIPPTVTDNCGRTINVALDATPTIPTCTGTVVYHYTYTDCAGKTQPWTYTYTISDPVWNAPAAGSLTVNCPAGVVTPTPPTITDNCGRPVTVTLNATPTIPTCTGNVVYNYTYTDCAGKTQPWTYTYTISVPDWNAPAAGSLTVDCPAGVVTPTPPTISDNCGRPVTVTLNETPTIPACSGTVVYDFTYTDCAGKTYNWVYTYTIREPVVTLPAPGASTVDCLAEAVAPTPPVVTDNCNNTLTPSAPVASADPACGGTKTYTFTYTDCAGKTYNWVYTYTIREPVVTLPAPGASTVDCLAEAVAPTPPVVTDNCNNTLTPSAPVASANPTCGGTKTYTFTYTDCAGKTYNWVYTYTIREPVVTLPAPGNSTVDCLAEAVAPTPPVVTDNCNNTLTPSAPVASADPACGGTKTYTFTYSDCAGKTYNWVYTYTIREPVVTLPAPGASTVDCLTEAVAPTPPVVTDNCNNTLTPSAPVASADPACGGTKTYTFTYSDCAGKTYNWVYTYTIREPVVTLPAPGASTVDCLTEAVAPTPPTVTDNCNNTLTPSAPVASADPACGGTKTYTFTYTDCAGKTYNWVYTYTIREPVVTLPAPGNSTVDCLAEAVAPTPPVVTDNCNNTLTPSAPVASADPACGGTKTYTFTYTDCAGKTYNWVYTYTIREPVVTLPAPGNSTVDCLTEAVAPTPPVVTDNCNNTLTPSAPVASANPACGGTKTYTFTYSDCAGKTYNWVYTYTIREPVVTLPAPGASTVDCLTEAVAPTPPTVTDNCNNTLTPSAPVASADPACGGTKTYTFTYTDCAGKTYNWVYTYTIREPVVTLPAPGASTVDCLTEAVAPTPPTVTDNCNNTLTPSAPVASADPACGGTKTYTFTYTDCAGKTYNWVYTYTIREPVVTLPAPGASTVDCLTEAVAPTPPTVTDNCNNTLTPSAPVASANPACGGTKTYTFTYSDCAGKTYNWVYTYTIREPVVTLPAPGASTVDCLTEAVAPTPPTVTDNCNNTLTPSAPVASADPACGGTKTYTFTYTDCAGKTYNWVYTYTIREPVVTLPAPGASTVDCLAEAVAPTPPVVTDNCNNTLTPSAPVASADPTCGGTKTYTFTYTDCAGKTYNWVYTYTIREPVVTLPAPGASTVDCLAEAVAPTPPVVTDNCNNTLTPSAPVASADPACGGTKTYTFTYTDCAGKTYNWVYTYTIREPVVTLPAPGASTVDCLAEAVAPTPPVVTDNCNNTLTPSAPVASANPACGGTKTYTFTYTDCTGKTYNWVYTYTIREPVVTLPAPGNSTVDCLAEAVAPTPPVVTDNCNNTLTPSAPVASADPACGGTKTYTFTYSDCAGKTYNWVYTYTIREPVVTLPAPGASTVDCLAEAVAPTPPVVTDTATIPSRLQLR